MIKLASKISFLLVLNLIISSCNNQNKKAINISPKDENNKIAFSIIDTTSFLDSLVIVYSGGDNRDSYVASTLYDKYSKPPWYLDGEYEMFCRNPEYYLQLIKELFELDPEVEIICDSIKIKSEIFLKYYREEVHNDYFKFGFDHSPYYDYLVSIKDTFLMSYYKKLINDVRIPDEELSIIKDNNRTMLLDSLHK